jgi:hypothetical protein
LNFFENILDDFLFEILVFLSIIPTECGLVVLEIVFILGCTVCFYFGFAILNPSLEFIHVFTGDVLDRLA